MIANNKILALIPARGGSKGIKNKNIISFAGKPLISHTIGAALKSKYVDSVVVSTDSNKIRTIALQYGAKVPFLRPKKIAGDTAKTVSAIAHGIKMLSNSGDNYDIIILLQPTSPLRNCFDIDEALECFIENNCKSVVSICEIENHPLLMRTIGKNNRLIHLSNKRSDLRRQDMKKYFYVNGAIYINKINKVNNSTSFNDNEIGYIMPKERSIDIDEEIDLIIAGVLIKNDQFKKQKV